MRKIVAEKLFDQIDELSKGAFFLISGAVTLGLVLHLESRRRTSTINAERNT